MTSCVKPSWVPKLLENESKIEIVGNVCLVKDLKLSKLQISHLKGTSIVLHKAELVTINVLLDPFSSMEDSVIKNLKAPMFIPIGNGVCVEVFPANQAVIITQQNNWIELNDWANFFENVQQWVFDDPALNTEIPHVYQNKYTS